MLHCRLNGLINLANHYVDFFPGHHQCWCYDQRISIVAQNHTMFPTPVSNEGADIEFRIKLGPGVAVVQTFAGVCRKEETLRW